MQNVSQRIHMVLITIITVGVWVQMPANERVSASFTPDRPGTYTFYCGIPGHEAAGMVGTLVVES